MSLLAWYPLIGNLNDYSGNNITATNVSAVINDNGKLGKCYSSANAGYIDIPASTVHKCKDLSISIWVKINSWNTSYATAFALNSAGGASWQDNLFSLIRDGATSKLTFTVADDNTISTTNTCISPDLNLNEWYHFTCTFTNGGKLTMYINGEEISSTYTIGYTPFVNVSTIRIGKNAGTMYQSDMMFNDFRIFNHVLSKKEVKEISKAKVLHYSFDEMQEPTVNLVTNPAFENSTGWALATNGAGTFSTANGWGKINIPVGETGKYYYIFQTVTKTTSPNIYTTFSVTFKNTVIGRFAIRLVIFDGASAVKQPMTYVALDGTGGTRSIYATDSYTGTSTSMRLDILSGSFYSTLSDVTVEFTSVQLEEKSYSTEFTLSSRSGIVRDSSGYMNDAVLNISDTPRWVSTSKFGSGAYEYSMTNKVITSPLTSTLPDITISGWLYLMSNTQWMLIDKATGGTSGSYYIYGSGSTDPQFSMFGPTGTRYDISLGSFELNKWYHFAGTFDSKTGIMRGYKNGILMGIKSGTTLGSNASSVIIGRYTSGYLTHGWIDDIRVYATALSEDDVNDLYTSRFSIDSNNTLYSHEYNEVIGYDPEINNTNLIINGNQSFKDNTNFPSFVYDDTEKAFSYTAGSSGPQSEEFIEIKGNGRDKFDRYVLDGWFKQKTGTMSRFYYMMLCYDKDKNFIDHHRVVFYSDTATTLSQPLNNGDTYVYLTTTANWRDDGLDQYVHTKTFACWPTGIAEYPDLTYSRHTAEVTFVDKTNNRLKLRNAWSQGTVPASSTAINSYSGSTYSYIAAVNALMTTEWKYYSGTSSATPDVGSMRYGTKYVLIGGLMNRDGGGTVTTYLKNLRFYNIDNPGQRVQSKYYPMSLNESGELISNSINEVGMNVRYIRDTMNGSSVNTGNHWVEIEAYDFTETNVARGKSATSPILTNGVVSSDPYYGLGSGYQTVSVDLGSIYFLAYLNIRHYYSDGRTYYFIKTEVSEDGINWMTIFDSEVDGRYPETANGKNIPLKASNLSMDKMNNIYINEINEVI